MIWGIGMTLTVDRFAMVAFAAAGEVTFIKLSDLKLYFSFMTFPRAIGFCVKKFELARICKGASHSLFIGLDPKSEIWKGSFRENSKFEKNGHKNEFSEDDNFLCKKFVVGGNCSGASNYLLSLLSAQAQM